jgi:predicted nucleotidyltransferase
MSATDSFGLSSHQRAIGDRVIAEESAKREHLVVYLSGAHAYGFPSPDSDLDLKTIHIAPTSALVGFNPPQPTFDRSEVIEGVEIDYTSNEIAHALSGILNGNGNFLERVLGRTALSSLPELEELRSLVRASLSRRVHRHYRGFAANQQKALEKEPTIKKLLYVLRTTLTGTHLLRTGELETNLLPLADAYELREAHELVQAKRAGERTAADPELLDAWRPKVADAFDRLDAALQRSVLPEEPGGVGAIEAWLIAVRRARF